MRISIFLSIFACDFENSDEMKKIYYWMLVLGVGLWMCSCTPGGKEEDPFADATVIERIQVQPLGTCIAYMLYEDESGKAFVFPLYVASGAQDIEYGKLYVYPGDMNPTYAYWMLSDYSTHALYTKATFKATKNEAGNLRIEATATDAHGDSWKLLYSY